MSTKLIHREAWLREAKPSLEEEFQQLQREIAHKNYNAFPRLGLLYERVPNLPPLQLPEATWVDLLPHLSLLLSKEMGPTWAADLLASTSPETVAALLWMGSKATNILPDVPKRYLQDIPIGQAPLITYSKGWEVITEESQRQGDYAGMGMEDKDTGEKVDFHLNRPTDYSRFEVTEELDDLMKWLEDEGYGAYDGESYIYKTLEYSDAQEEFGFTYGPDLSDPETPYANDGPPNEVLAGKLTVFFDNPQHNEQIKKWLNER